MLDILIKNAKIVDGSGADAYFGSVGVKDGKLVYDAPALTDVRRHCEEEIEGMWDEVRRFNNPHNYYVDLSEKLWQIKHDMIAEYRNRR